MKSLMIKDLSITEELDRDAMAAVHGGMGKGMPSYDWGSPKLGFEKSEFNFTASQMLGQAQETVVNNGNNAAFVSGITATVTPHQTGTNTINFG